MGAKNGMKSDGKPGRIWLPSGLVIPTHEADKLVKVKIRNADYERQLDKV
jgi:hypothetical protein